MTEEYSFLLCKPFTSSRIVTWFNTGDGLALVSYYLFHCTPELTFTLDSDLTFRPEENISHHTDGIKLIEA